MKRKLLFLLCCFFISMQMTNAQQFTDATKIGGSGDDYIASSDHDKQGNLYVLGYFSGTASFGSTTLSSDGGLDLFVLKYNKAGQIVWTQQIGSSTHLVAGDLLIDGRGNVVVSGVYDGTIVVYEQSGDLTASHNHEDIFYVQYDDDDGEVITAGTFGFDYDSSPTGLASTSGGKVFMSGQIKYASTNFDGFVSRLNLNGQSFWLEDFGGRGMDIVNDIALSPSGDIYLCGAFEGTMELGNFSTLEVTANGGYDGFIIRVTENSTLGTFIRTSSGSSSEIVSYFNMTTNGNDLYLSGTFTSSATFANITINNLETTAAGFYCKLNHNTSTDVYSIEYAKTLDHNAGFTLNQIEVTDDDEIYIGGYFQGTVELDNTDNLKSKGSNDIMVLKADEDGDVISALGAGSSDDDRNFGLSIYDNEVTASGAFQNTVAFGSNSLSSSGGLDGFVTTISEKNASIEISSAPGQSCEGEEIQVSVVASDIEVGNQYSLYISDENGNFNSSTLLGTLNSNTNASINATLPLSLSEGTNYRFKVTSSLPSLESIYNGNFTLSKLPTKPTVIGPLKVEEFAKEEYSTSFTVGSTYTWSITGGNQLTGTNTNSISVQWGDKNSSPGNVSVVEQNGAGCVSESGSLDININFPIGISESSSTNSMEVYPTMATSALLIKANTASDENLMVSIYSIDGKIISQETIRGLNANIPTSISIDELTKGTYLLQLTSDSKTIIKRFQKM